MFDYDLVRVEEVLPPEGAVDTLWHCYVLENETTHITGYRAGSRMEVEEYARQCVQRLNAKHRISFRSK